MGDLSRNPASRPWAALLLAAMLAGPAAAQPVGPALDRPAQPVRAPERQVVLAAAQAGSTWVVVGERGLVMRAEEQLCAGPPQTQLLPPRGAERGRGTVPADCSSPREESGLASPDAACKAERGRGTVPADCSSPREGPGPASPGAACKAGAVCGTRGSTYKGLAGWRQVPVPVSVTLTAVRFADAQTGVAVGHGGAVLVSHDGGRSWARRLDGRRVAELLLAEAQTRGDAAAEKAARQLQADGPDKPWLDVLLPGAGRIVVVGAYGLAMASDDGGTTWTSWSGRLDNPKGLHLYALRQRGTRIVIAGEQGLVLKSEDGGASFQRLETPYKGSFFTLELPDPHEIVLAGLRGQVWRSSDGGHDWAPLALPMPVSVVGSQLAADGTLLLASQAGFVYARRDGAFVPLHREPLPPLTGLAAGRGEPWLALSLMGVLPVSAKP